VLELAIFVGVLLGFSFGVLAGVCIPFQIRRPVGRCSGSPSGEHEFARLKGAFGYCLHCTARKRFLNG
jgi:hypothetical protein